MINRNGIDLSRVQYLVLDEADRLLDETYLADLKLILDNSTTKNRQTLMFSATMTSTLDCIMPTNTNVDAIEREQDGKERGIFRFDASKNL